MIAMPEYTVGKTKEQYSKIQKQALLGLMPITKNRHTGSPVIHLSKELFEIAINELSFTVHEEIDDEIGGMTISVDEIPAYGEGDTRLEAIEDLIDAAIEVVDLFIDDPERYSILLSKEEIIYTQKLILCSGDRDKIRRALLGD